MQQRWQKRIKTDNTLRPRLLASWVRTTRWWYSQMISMHKLAACQRRSSSSGNWSPCTSPRWPQSRVTTPYIGADSIGPNSCGGDSHKSPPQELNFVTGMPRFETVNIWTIKITNVSLCQWQKLCRFQRKAFGGRVLPGPTRGAYSAPQTS